MSDNNIRNKSLRLRIYPNKTQEILINKTFGCCRLIYNLHLEERLKFYENNLKDIKDKSERIEILKTFKPKTEKEWKVDYPFLKEVGAQSLQQARINCGYKYYELKLSERQWTCPSCGKFHIRDVNAAINLKYYVPSERGEFMPVEGIEGVSNIVSEALECPVKQEADSL